jgi:hypothetical protein
VKGLPFFGGQRVALAERYLTALRGLVETRGAAPTATLLRSSVSVVYGALGGGPILARTAQRISATLEELIERGTIEPDGGGTTEVVCGAHPVCRCSGVADDCACRRQPRIRRARCIDCGAPLFRARSDERARAM